MTLVHAASDDESLPLHLIVLITALVRTITPAFYAASWTPWLRYVIGSCIVVVLIILVRETGTCTIPAL